MPLASYLKAAISNRRKQRRRAGANIQQQYNPERPFADRADAGRKLATQLMIYANNPNLLVLALPRGGVPIAYEIARALHAPLDVFLVRKLGVPLEEELAMGAIATGGVRVLNEEATNFPDSIIDNVAKREQRELERRERLYRGDRPALDIEGRAIILVDDGLATGATMRAAAIALRQMKPLKIVVAVPVAPPETCEAFRSEVEEVICAITPDPFIAVGVWYSDFSQTSDEEVRQLLEQASQDEDGNFLTANR
ncbi:MAG TPA: phosphoribosyltransferase [Candidatus Binatia bacterium]